MQSGGTRLLREKVRTEEREGKAVHSEPCTAGGTVLYSCVASAES